MTGSPRLKYGWPRSARLRAMRRWMNASSVGKAKSSQVAAPRPTAPMMTTTSAAARRIGRPVSLASSRAIAEPDDTPRGTAGASGVVRPLTDRGPGRTITPCADRSRAASRGPIRIGAEGRMGKSLTSAAVAAYARDGYHFPVPVLTPAGAREYRERLERAERDLGGPLRGVYRVKPHLLFTWLADLVRHPAILDAVEDALGPDLLCWNTSFFTKEARSPGFVSWHQDATYWGLSEPDVLTAWVAFTESTPDNGNMRVVPKSHRGPVPHVDTFHPDNLLSRGQEITVAVDEADAADIVLRPGELSLHHVLIVHGSGANPSADRRIGFAIRYIPTRIRQTGGPRDSATLVRGTDAFGHFELEPRPDADLDPAMLALHAEISDRQAKILYRGTARTRF